MQQLPSARNHQNSVMSGVCYGQSLVVVIYSDFPRERQDAGRQGVSVQLDPHRVRFQQALLPIVAEGSISEKHQPVAVAFAHQGEEQVATRSQQDQRGPTGHLQFVPELRLAVVDHWVADVIAEHGTANVPQDL